MYENDYMYAVERNGDSLAHYGVRGMKWGVRKAIASGNAKKLSRQYAKASKKLAKLEKQAGKSKKYAKRAALMGAGAAAAGGLAVAGTSGVGTGLRKIGGFAGKASSAAGNALMKTGNKYARSVGSALKGAGATTNSALVKAGLGTESWGKTNSLGNAAARAGNNARNAVRRVNIGYGKVSGYQGVRRLDNALVKSGMANTQGQINKLRGVSNDTIARVGAGAIGVGLAAGAARNAYKAATAQKKAARFKSEMNKAFAGTKYANGNGNRQGGKRKKRR